MRTGTTSFDPMYPMIPHMLFESASPLPYLRIWDLRI
jgi:hypothetical protein